MVLAQYDWGRTSTSESWYGLTTVEELYHLHVGCPWQMVAIDSTGPLDVTPRGNKWILVKTDHFTGWTNAIPLPDTTARTVAETLFTSIVACFGCPETLHNNQGRQFDLEFMQALCLLWEIDKTSTSSYRPQSNSV